MFTFKDAQVILAGLLCFILFNRAMAYVDSHIPIPPIGESHHVRH
jgi:hypothetical protein